MAPNKLKIAVIDKQYRNHVAVGWSCPGTTVIAWETLAAK